MQERGVNKAQEETKARMSKKKREIAIKRSTTAEHSCVCDCYILGEKSSFDILKRIPHLPRVSENTGFAFAALKQRVLLVPGLKAASTFNLQ